MPRQKKIVTEKLDPKSLHEHSIKRNIKLHSPYAVVKAAELELDSDDYKIVYKAPLGGNREIVASRNVHENALSLRDMLNRAWALGYWSSNRADSS